MKDIIVDILNIFYSSLIFIIKYWFFFLIAIFLLFVVYKSIRFFLLKCYKKAIINLIMGFLIFVFSWLFIGYIHYPFDDNDTIPDFFLKKKPTVQLRFYDIYLSDGDIPKFNRLNKQQKQQQIDYCKYRYGVNVANDNELISCIKEIHPDIDVDNPNG